MGCHEAAGFALHSRLCFDVVPCLILSNQPCVGKSFAMPPGSSPGTRQHNPIFFVVMSISRSKGRRLPRSALARPADHADAIEIDGRGFAILPGFIDIHAHPSSEPMLKGLTDEVGSRQLYMSSLYEYLPLFEADAEGRKAATEVALCELLQSGVTTVCDLFFEMIILELRACVCRRQ